MDDKKILLILVAFSAIVFLLTINFNGIFMDEEYYIKVGKFFLSGRLGELYNPLQIMFGNYLAPAIFAIGDYIGGFLFVRFINSIFIIGTLVLVYFITKELFNNKKTAVIAFLLSLSFSPIFFLARFVVIDTPSLFFTTLSMFLLLLGSNRNRKTYLIASSLSLFLAFISKYISIIFFIPLLLIILCRKRKYAQYFAIPYVLLASLYLIIFMNELKILLSAKLLLQTGQGDIMFAVISLLAPYAILSLFTERRRLLAVFSIGVLVFLLCYSLMTSYLNAIKHTAMAFLFLVPFASDGLKNLISGSTKIDVKKIIIAVILIVVIALSFVGYNSYLENFFVNEEKPSAVLDNVINSTDYVLVEGSAFRYYTKKLSDDHVIDNFWLDYDKDGNSNISDYEAAIRAGMFKAVMSMNYYPPYLGILDYINETSYNLIYEENHTVLTANIILRIYVRPQQNKTY